jgi:hypothetical protein
LGCSAALMTNAMAAGALDGGVINLLSGGENHRVVR